jgi:hypothetical protein
MKSTLEKLELEKEDSHPLSPLDEWLLEISNDEESELEKEDSHPCHPPARASTSDGMIKISTRPKIAIFLYLFCIKEIFIKIKYYW